MATITINETQIRQGDAARAKRDRRMRHIQTQWVPRIILILMCLVFILPFYWMLALGLKSNTELAIYPPTLYPNDPQWQNFRQSTEVFPFWSFARNTLFITVLTIVGAVISNPIIAYGFSRIDWPGRDKVFLLVLATVFMPFPVIIVALVDTYARLGWMNTYL
ncbi:MAG: carbohydrate ABC transporter permease, partial [Chloroflexia bacterium]|nr:carbohydrate ABC transporter permease [Chloroflexia bacterium]